eukprot:1159331-Pelagomonas_calceolata.AAC.3
MASNSHQSHGQQDDGECQWSWNGAGKTCYCKVIDIAHLGGGGPAVGTTKTAPTNNANHYGNSTLFIRCLEHLSDPTTLNPLDIIHLVLFYKTPNHNKHDVPFVSSPSFMSSVFLARSGHSLGVSAQLPLYADIEI